MSIKRLWGRIQRGWMKMDEKRRFQLIDAYVVLFIALASLFTLIIRVHYICSWQGPVIYGDEICYKFRAEELFYGEDYFNSHYPLSYPLVISLSFLFHDFYTSIKIINIMLSIVGTIGCYKLFRLFLSPQKSTLCSMLMFLLPWQTNTGAFIMSENLAYPLLIWIAYLFLYVSANRPSWYFDVILGILICFLHLTKHMFVTLLPVFFVFWFVKRNENGKWVFDASKENVRNALIIISSYLLGYVVLWIIPRIRMGEDILTATGFQTFVISAHEYQSTQEAGRFDWKRLFTSAWAYIGYFCLALLYMLPACVMGLLMKKKNESPMLHRMMFLLTGVSLMCLAVAIRHSYLASYNTPVFSHIMGRYILYSITLSSVMSMILLCGHIRKTDSPRCRWMLELIILACAAVWILAEKSLIEGHFGGFRVSFLNTYGNEELMPYKRILIPIGVILLFQAVVVLVFKKTGKVYFYFVVLSCSAIFLVVNCMTGFAYSAVGEREILSRSLSDYDKKTESLSSYSFIINDVPGRSMSAMLAFWETKESGSVIGDDGEGMANQLRNKGLLRSLNDEYYANKKVIREFRADDEILHDSNAEKTLGPGLLYTASFEVESAHSDSLLSVVYNGIQYSLYELPLYRKIEVIETWPHGITCNVKFNKQPNGLSALVFQTNIVSPGSYVVYLNGEAYAQTKISDDGRGSILIDDEFYRSAGELHVEVHSKHYGAFYMKEECNDYVIPISELDHG